VSKWKEWTTKTLKINWQRDFFEHQLRKEESLREKQGRRDQALVPETPTDDE